MLKDVREMHGARGGGDRMHGGAMENAREMHAWRLRRHYCTATTTATTTLNDDDVLPLPLFLPQLLLLLLLTGGGGAGAASFFFLGGILHAPHTRSGQMGGGKGK